MAGDVSPERVARHMASALSTAFTGCEASQDVAQKVTVGVLAGEGIGPQVTQVAVDVLQCVARHSPQPFDIRYGGVIGAASEKANGAALSPEVISFCESVFADGGAILCGPGGARFVYDLRACFDLFCKLTPVQPFPSLCDTGVLRPEARRGIEMVIVRENAGGLYFGKWDRKAATTPEDQAKQTFDYRACEVDRIISVAVRLAACRSRRLTLVIKKGAMPTISALWVHTFQELVRGHDLETQVLEVDNAAYQLVANSRGFDVVVAPNLFGDILSDLAALMLGSRGLSYSGNFGGPRRAVYQTGHGAAHDLAGRSVANPIGQILSAAMMLRQSFGMTAAADAIWVATQRTLAAGIRTADIATSTSTIVGTDEMGQSIARAVERELTSRPVAS